MLVIQFAKLFHRGRKLRGLDFSLCRSALGGVANKLQFVGLVDRHGTAPRSHGLKGQRATFLLAVTSGPAFREARRLLGTPLCNSLHRCGAFVGKTMHAVR